jgi:threonine synthase
MSSIASPEKLGTHDRGIIARYREHLPVKPDSRIISLNEGSTPLIHSPKLSAKVGHKCRVFIKYEGLNPSGSFKDRGMTMAITKAVEKGAEAVVCASTGNTSASAAAYASRAGLLCIVILPAGKIAKGKLAQAIVHGAKIVNIDGNFDDALRIVRQMGETGKVEIVNSINPFRIEGQKTASFEIVDELEDAPDIHILPVGNAGNITAYWKGYTEYRDKGHTSNCPRMIGFQAAGSAPIFHNQVIEQPETCATAIRIGNPASWSYATQAIQESAGYIDIVTDEEILEAQAWLAREEGIFVEPASAASIAGLMKCMSSRRCAKCPFGNIQARGTIVCTVTGHGLKDTDTALRKAEEPMSAPNDYETIMGMLDLL